MSTPSIQGRPELVGRLVELQRSRPPATGAWPAQAAADARYAGGLRQARIRARTLVLHGGADTVVDPRNGKLIADRIPGAQLTVGSLISVNVIGLTPRRSRTGSCGTAMGSRWIEDPFLTAYERGACNGWSSPHPSPPRHAPVWSKKAGACLREGCGA